MEKGQQIAEHEKRSPEDQPGRSHHNGHRRAHHHDNGVPHDDQQHANTHG